MANPGSDGRPGTESHWSIVDDHAAFNATTNSHNRKIAEAGPCVFLGYRDGDSVCRIAKSRDSGDTWEQVDLPELEGMQAPVLVADRDERVHIVFRMQNSDMRYLRLGPDDDWSSTETSRDVVTAGPKYTLEYDAVNDLLFLSHRVAGSLRITVLDTDGETVRTVPLVNSDKQGNSPDYMDPHYQSMFADSEGWLHLIYTRTDFHLDAESPDDRYRYHSVHYLRTRDAGLHWERADGGGLDVPYEIGDGAPDVEVNTEEEREASGGIWGASLAVANGQVHVLYSAPDSGGPVYARLDRETAQVTGRARMPFDGSALALAVTPGTAGEDVSPLFAFGNLEQRPALAVTMDNGDTWHLAGHIADVPIRPDQQIHWLTCMSHVSREGWICSAFTARLPGVPESKVNGGRVFFVRWRLGQP